MPGTWNWFGEAIGPGDLAVNVTWMEWSFSGGASEAKRRLGHSWADDGQVTAGPWAHSVSSVPTVNQWPARSALYGRKQRGNKQKRTA